MQLAEEVPHLSFVDLAAAITALDQHRPPVTADVDGDVDLVHGLFAGAAEDDVMDDVGVGVHHLVDEGRQSLVLGSATQLLVGDEAVVDQFRRGRHPVIFTETRTSIQYVWVAARAPH